MTSNSQGSESAKISTILERYQAEWNYHEQDCLLVDMPAEQERCVATQRYSTNEGLPSRFVQKAEEDRLDDVSSIYHPGYRYTYYLCSKSKKEAYQWVYVRKYCERRVSHKPSSDAIHCLLINMEPKARGHWQC